ncbi:hypothetical protein C1J03_11790 [Sulfitobacter sp. SK012]|uniref:hypothetical protein n=1 Tax=Sulfitobacter sp. SK012 TaxID=1389005 RepID=UPI000E0A816F|nr:hypothetical protein [Sulfitobacter sp. SK012]AXI46641.1 hypothetical protein C1J03_11790 [Sulfitobacter sp. SK012]
MKSTFLSACLMFCISAAPAFAEWGFSDSPSPNAFIQTNNMTLELQCDRIRFAPAGYQDSETMIQEQGLSIRFMEDGATEAGSFQAGQGNATLQIVDNYPVEVVFQDAADYQFVLDQIAANAAINLSMTDQDVSYGVFDLKGSSKAIKSLRSSCGSAPQTASSTMEAPEGVVFCGGGQVQRQIEYLILDNPKDEWDAIVTVNGEATRALTAYSYFGNALPPQGFVVALLGEDQSEFLVFKDGSRNYIELGDYQYDQCN